MSLLQWSQAKTPNVRDATPLDAEELFTTIRRQKPSLGLILIGPDCALWEEAYYALEEILQENGAPEDQAAFYRLGYDNPKPQSSAQQAPYFFQLTSGQSTHQLFRDCAIMCLRKAGATHVIGIWVRPSEKEQKALDVSEREVVKQLERNPPAPEGYDAFFIVERLTGNQ